MSQSRQIGASVLAGILASGLLSLALGLEASAVDLAGLSMLCVPLAVIGNQLFSGAAAKGRR